MGTAYIKLKKHARLWSKKLLKKVVNTTLARSILVLTPLKILPKPSNKPTLPRIPNVNAIIQPEHSVVGFEANEAHAAAYEVAEVFLIPDIGDFAAGVTPAAEVGEADCLDGEAVPGVFPYRMAVLQVEDELGRSTVDPVAGATDVHLAIEDEGREGAVHVCGKPDPEAEGQVPKPTFHFVVTEVVPADHKIIRVAIEGTYRLEHRFVDHSFQAFPMKIQIAVGVA